MCVRHCTLWNGVDNAVHGSYGILGCPFFPRLLSEPFELSETQHNFACEQHSVHCLHLVVAVLTTGHQEECVFATYEPYLDTDTVEKKSVLEEDVEV